MIHFILLQSCTRPQINTALTAALISCCNQLFYADCLNSNHFWFNFALSIIFFIYQTRKNIQFSNIFRRLWQKSVTVELTKTATPSKSTSLSFRCLSTCAQRCLALERHSLSVNSTMERDCFTELEEDSRLILEEKLFANWLTSQKKVILQTWRKK